MSEREDVIARLEAKGVKVDRRLSTAKLAALDSEIDDSDNDEPEPAEERIEVPPSPEPPAESGVWPRQVAPIVWVDRAGRRYTDLGEARAGDEELR